MDNTSCTAGAAGTQLRSIPKRSALVTEQLSETATFGHHLSEAAAGTQEGAYSCRRLHGPKPSLLGEQKFEGFFGF